MSDLKITLERGNAAPQDVTEAVQIIYDALYNSMDAGSGFLDKEEEDALRELAKLAGFDPPHFPGDVCVCGHSPGLHYQKPDPHCNGTVVVSEPVYGRQKRTRLAPVPITEEEHNRVQALLREAQDQDEVNMILAGAATKIAIKPEEYYVTVCLDRGDRKPCECKGWEWRED
jgi:hypothetical protein